MSIVKVTEVSSASEKSFEDAIREGIRRVSETVHGIQSAWVNEQKVVINDREVVEWRVNMRVSFVVDK